MAIEFDITIERIKSDCSNLIIEPNQSYLIAYPEFVQYFFERKGRELNKHDIIISSHFVYGWMPTILTLDISRMTDVLKYLNKAKNENLNKEELEVLCKCFNGSLVGTSKLLHFINPNLYAIWDSWVFKYLTKGEVEAFHYRMSDCSLYLKYLERCKIIIQNIDFQEIKKELIGKFNCSGITDLRAIEMVMYETQRRK